MYKGFIAPVLLVLACFLIAAALAAPDASTQDARIVSGTKETIRTRQINEIQSSSDRKADKYHCNVRNGLDQAAKPLQALIQITDAQDGSKGFKDVRFVLRRNYESPVVNIKHHPRMVINKFAAKFKVEVDRLVEPSPSAPLREGYPKFRDIPELVVMSEKEGRRASVSAKFTNIASVIFITIPFSVKEHRLLERPLTTEEFSKFEFGHISCAILGTKFGIEKQTQFAGGAN